MTSFYTPFDAVHGPKTEYPQMHADQDLAMPVERTPSFETGSFEDFTRSTRDGGLYNPHPSRLLDDYIQSYLKRDPGSMGNTIVRQRSLDARYLVARFILGDKGDLDDLIELARNGKNAIVGFGVRDVQPARLASFARILTLQNILPGDLQNGLSIYDYILESYGPEKVPTPHQDLHAQLAYGLGDVAKTRRLLKVYQKMTPRVRDTLRLNLVHPGHRRSGDWESWFRVLEELMPPARYAMSLDLHLPAMDRLTARPFKYCQDTSRVSVAITCFKPGRELVTAVSSIAAQSWRNLEILLIDDGSPAGYSDILQRCTELDDRVKLIRLPQNSGTYVARNIALDMASGDFLTFQDSDDWSHPNRIEHQLSLMLANPGLVVTTANGLKVNEDLTINRIGRPVVDISMPTTMLRLKEVKARVGYFHSVRKAADGEYLGRLKAAFGDSASLHEKATALKLIRQGSVSLSRTDFGTGGWMHPAREAYMSAYVHWHNQIRSGQAKPYLESGDNQRKIPAPPHLLTNGEATPEARYYDYVLASDWRPFGAPAKAMIEEIKAIRGSGRTVAVLQMETYRYMSTPVRPLCGPIQELINDGAVDRIVPTDPTETGVLIIRYPSVLQFGTGQPINLRPRRVVILANQAPRERDGSDWRYVPSVCSTNAQGLFGVKPVWAPEGPETREALAADGTLASAEIADFNIPCVLNVDEWFIPRARYRSDLPVIGRHSRDHHTKWPATRESILEVYPDDPAFDVRVMGGTRAVLSALGTDRLPKNWTSFDYDEIPVKAFLHQLDFWVYFHHPILVESFGRAILEAMATGCVVILPETFRKTFGEGAVYCESDEVRSVIRYYYADFERYRIQSNRAVAYACRNFSHDTYLALLQQINSI